MSREYYCLEHALYLVFPPRPSMLPPPAPPPSTVEFNLPPPKAPPLPPPAPQLRFSPPAWRTIASTFLATEPSLTCAFPVLPVPALLTGASAPGASISAFVRSSRNARNQEAASARRAEKALRWSAAVRSFPVRLLLFAWSLVLAPILRKDVIEGVNIVECNRGLRCHA